MRTSLLLAASLFAVGCQKSTANAPQAPVANASPAPNAPSPSSPAGAMQDTSNAAQAAPPTEGVGASGAQASAQDDDPQIVVDRVHAINQFEIQVGHLALEHGTKRVHGYAEHLVKDHASADHALDAAAKKASLTVQDPSAVQWPSDIAAAMAHDEAALADLEKRSGDAFDAKFLSMMVEGHQGAVAYVKQARSKVGAGPLASYLAQLEPTLEAHLKMAEGLSKHAPKVQGRR